MVIHSFDGKIVNKKQLTKDVIILSFDVPDEFSFKAGQFVTLFIEKDGVRKPRSYSILNPPSKKGLDLCIKIVEDGFASKIFNNCKVGDEFAIKGPLGHFVYDEEDTNSEVFFLCAGTGVTPFYSMVKEYLPKSLKKFTLLFGVRRQENLFLRSEFESLASKNNNFSFQPVLSREDWDGLQGHVQDHLPDDCKNKTFYICGLKELVLETKELLVKLGVDPTKIKSERYS
jgi:ferredoxin-NADP reductase